ncbi:MAG: alaS, partial [Geminicoccaceae bacterium]|nr:alaS [Geminicoccaceae bacterium]
VRHEERLLAEAAGALRVAAQELPERVATLLAERKRLEQEISRLRQQLATGGGGPATSEAREVAGIRFAGRRVEGVPAKDLRGLADAMQRQIGSGVAAVVSRRQGRRRARRLRPGRRARRRARRGGACRDRARPREPAGRGRIAPSPRQLLLTTSATWRRARLRPWLAARRAHRAAALIDNHRRCADAALPFLHRLVPRALRRGP